MLMSTAGSCPVQTTANEKAVVDKATETSATWDLDDSDIDDLLEDADPAHSCCVLLEAMSQLSTLPIDSRPIDSVQPHPVSVQCCRSGNCVQFVLRYDTIRYDTEFALEN